MGSRGMAGGDDRRNAMIGAVSASPTHKRCAHPRASSARLTLARAGRLPLAQQAQGIVTAGGQRHVKAQRRQPPVQQVAVCLFVVNHQHAFAGAVVTGVAQHCCGISSCRWSGPRR